MKIPFTKSKQGITIKVRVDPRSSRSGITDITADTLKVKVHAPPVGGSANEELREILSEKFRIRKSSITVIKGGSSKDKLVEISGIDSLS